MMDLEICVESVESAVAAEEGGAQRVELCSALSEGGLTPSAAMIKAARARIGIGVHVMIRPRSGDFVYSDDEFEVMREDIRFARQSGATGVVIGLLTADGEVDVERSRQLVELSRPMQVTFHRAIDISRSIEGALEGVIATGADRVLTSGAQQNAMLGAPMLGRLVTQAAGRIRIMAGGGVRAHNARQLAALTGVEEFHAALRTPVASVSVFRNDLVHLGEPGRDEYARYVVLAEDVRALRVALDSKPGNNEGR